MSKSKEKTMSEKNESIIALDRFAESLQAFRQTLPEEQQIMLDGLVANATFDVESHAFVGRFTAGDVPVAKTAGAVTLAAAAAAAKDDDPDVAAHAMTEQKLFKLTAEDGRYQGIITTGDGGVGI
jgi:hypothetical protein